MDVMLWLVVLICQTRKFWIAEPDLRAELSKTNRNTS